MYLTFNGKTMTTNGLAKALGLSFYQVNKLLKRGLSPEAIAADTDEAKSAVALANDLGLPTAKVRAMRAQGCTVAQIKAEALA
jgi:hypothetical protein